MLNSSFVACCDGAGGDSFIDVGKSERDTTFDTERHQVRAVQRCVS